MRLVLTRRRGDGLTIEVPLTDGTHEKIHIFIPTVQGGQCQLAIDAEPHVTIMRDELLGEAPVVLAKGRGHA